MRFSFTIPGEPQGKERPRFSTAGGFARCFTAKKTADYERRTAALARAAMSAEPSMSGEPFDGPVSMEIRAFFPIPKSWSRKKREEAQCRLIFPTVKPDADNLAKIIMDSLNRIAWKDDAQVFWLSIEKHYDANPRVEVEICFFPETIE